MTLPTTPPAAAPVLDRITVVLLWCFVFTVPFERVWMFPGIGTMSRFLGLALVPIAVTALLFRGSIKRLLFAHLCMVVFVGWSALSILWTYSTELTAGRVYTEVQVLCAVLLIWQFSSGAGAEKLMKAYIYGTIVSSVGTLENFLAGETVSWDRYAAEGFDPNDLCLALAISIPLSYYFFLKSRGLSALCWLGHIALVTVSCLLTGSRMGSIVILVALLAVPLSAAQLKGWHAATLALAIGAGAVVGPAFVPASSWERLQGTLGELQSGTMSDRTEIWRRGLELVRQEPFTGVGAGAFQDAVSRVPGNTVASAGNVAHNTFLSVLSEVGFIGAMLFLVVLSSLAVLVFEMTPAARRTWLITFAVWAIGVFTLTWEHRKPTWVVFALLIQHWSATASPGAGESVLTASPLTPSAPLPRPLIVGGI